MHPQTSSVVESFQGTLKKMLKAYVNKNDEEWDTAVFYYLHKAVPGAKYDYSLYETLYGRYVHGPLGVVYYL